MFNNPFKSQNTRNDFIFKNQRSKIWHDLGDINTFAAFDNATWWCCFVMLHSLLATVNPTGIPTAMELVCNDCTHIFNATLGYPGEGRLPRTVRLHTCLQFKVLTSILCMHTVHLCKHVFVCANLCENTEMSYLSSVWSNPYMGPNPRLQSSQGWESEGSIPPILYTGLAHASDLP